MILLISILFLLILICTFVFVRKCETTEYNESDNYLDDNLSSSKQRYQISASVSSSFYNDVQGYCRKHGITVSDLIRNAVRDYIRTSSFASASYAKQSHSQEKSSNSWECPNCGRTNASYVGTCACGISRSDALKNPSNKTRHCSSSKATVPSDSWKCPKCGIINSNLVGTCACGTTKPKEKITTYYYL